MDKSWMETNRISKSYVDGVAAFTDYAVHNLQKTGNIDPRVNKKHIYIPCPCTKCLNHIEHKVEEVQYHLYRHGIDISYTKWTKHGEEDEPSISAPKPVNATTEFVDDIDFAYIPTDGPTTVEMVNATKDNFDVDDLVKFQELLLDAEKPLYEGCPDFTKFVLNSKTTQLKLIQGFCSMWKDKNCVRLFSLSKQSYVGHRRYLPYNHPFKKQKKAFNGQQEFLQAPIPMTREQIYNEVKHIENKWGKGKRTNNNASKNQEDTRGRGGKIQKQKRNTTEEEGSSSQVNGQNGVYWKKFNIWYRKLKYWRHNPVPHCIDFMHVEKNVAESIVGTLLHVPGKTKDGLNARLDLAELGVKLELFAMQDEDKTTLPPTGYTLTNAEKDIFCETLHNIKVPEGYCSNFSSLVNLKDRKLIGLKSHDYHMLMQKFLPITIHSIMHPPTRYVIIRFCFFFKLICSKEIILQELDKMQAELVVTLCLLEKFFPPSFFDIMIHLTVHLTREVKLCGPICFRWMYPFERCMKVIKGHVRNRNKPEGCIAEETIAEETIEFFSEYHKSMETIGIPPDKHETYENEEGKPLSAGKSSEVSAELFQKAHLYVIQNTDEIVPYIERHKQVLKTENPGKRIAFMENKHRKYFAKWLRKEVERELAIDKKSVSETVRWISYRPRATVVKYNAYNINGYTFRTKCHDGKVYQNSMVLDYRFRQIPLFKCDWVNHKSGGVKRDKLGYTLVDLNNLGHKVDPFVLASQALQVFYVKDPVDKKLSIVFKTPPKNYKDTYDEVDEEFSTIIHHRNDNVLPLVDQRDLANESRDDYYRKDCGGSNPFLRPYPHTILLSTLVRALIEKTSLSMHSSDFVVNLQKTLLLCPPPEPTPKSLLKWYHYLSDEYKDNGRFWGLKSGCNESDVKPYWKDIKKAKACMLAKAQASDASSKAKEEHVI
ncbi:putative transposase-associated domain-containing protein [Tanacetum coccineum]|uniref:Transposase-associated domain-containing protein n=1 Tax=Tanacetum coccineum TaxID=301880 RepID=A0ABQ5E0M2_9ASTR